VLCLKPSSTEQDVEAVWRWWQDDRVAFLCCICKDHVVHMGLTYRMVWRIYNNVTGNDLDE
jgi:hypothetical protein